MQMDCDQRLADVLQIIQAGAYVKDGKTVPLKLTKSQMEACAVYLPEDIEKILNSKDFPHVHKVRRMGVGCKNTDSISMALEQDKYMRLNPTKIKKNVLVLNFANPVHPGGGARCGSDAQEESLCYRSSLLLSLESEEAKKYYSYNRSLWSDLASDAIILTPDVEIIKDATGALLDQSVVVAVMSCAAPKVWEGYEGHTQEEYELLLYNRICAMLKCAAYWGYEYLVLGAFGCGAFGNDARVVSDLFYKALKEFDYDGMKAKDFFCRVGFAVLDRRKDHYNLNAFMKNFENFYRDEDEAVYRMVQQRRKSREVYRDAIRGSLFGGAAGDALGYTVEFWEDYGIFDQYGPEGITAYVLDRRSGKALISDDTQMTLFTANGLLVGDTRGCMRGIQGAPRGYVKHAYMDWLFTQTCNYTQAQTAERRGGRVSWLLDVPELYARRAPGNTCLCALENAGDFYGGDYIAEPRNNSKGCGGVMRVAPVALCYQWPIEKLDLEAAQIAAITHGHSLGYMPAAVLCHIINRIVYPTQTAMSLKQIVLEAKETAKKLFAGDVHLKELTDLIDLAIALSENELDDLENIRTLGEGWVAEETLAIAIYCSLRYTDDFSGGIIAAVNHSGDSDSTGAVTGNILGAIVGYDAIADKWKQDLECADVILEMADDLCYGCQMSEYSPYTDPAWMQKYMQMHWQPKN